MFKALHNPTPARMHAFAKRRIEQMKRALVEIGGCYADIDNYVVSLCDDLLSKALTELEEAIEFARAEGGHS